MMVWNDWTIAETDALKSMVRRRASETTMCEELRRFNWRQITEKIDRLVEQGHLVVPGSLA